MKEFPSQAYPIIAIACTTGLNAQELLGFFAENVGFGGTDQESHPDAKAVYLIDRFANRFQRFTAPSLHYCNVIRQTRMDDLLSQDCFELSSTWLTIHEHGHNDCTVMPYRHFTNEKKTLFGAGFEELRVDLYTIQKLFQRGAALDHITADYVFAERLLAYPIVDVANAALRPSFDTVGTVYLLCKLIKCSQAEVLDGKLMVKKNWHQSIGSIVNDMSARESEIISLPASERPKALVAHVEQVTNSCRNQLETETMPNGFQLPILYRHIHDSIEAGAANSKDV